MTNCLILSINGGSSSIKFAIHDASDEFSLCHAGSIERIGISDSSLVLRKGNNEPTRKELPVPDFSSAISLLEQTVKTLVGESEIKALSHRIVHGFHFDTHMRITENVVSELKKIMSIDPEHLPTELALIERLMTLFPNVPHVACFDTVFHSTIPAASKQIALPRRFKEIGLSRYGFHGLSCAYLVDQLGKIDPSAKMGKVIIAHLGNGASITATEGGESKENSMGFSPTGGILMSSRSGDIDPMSLLYAMEREGLTVEEAKQVVSHESGLLGISGKTGDMYDLLQNEATDPHVKLAIDVFCLEVKKRIGSYAALLGGLDTLIFTGGVGEQSSLLRERICGGLEFLGITIRHDDNQKHDAIISGEGKITVRVMHTDESLYMAHIAYPFLTQK